MSALNDPRLKAEQLAVETIDSIDHEVKVLGSKSYTNRRIAIAALAALDGKTGVIDGALVSDDTVYFADAVASFGHVGVEVDHQTRRFTLTPPPASR